MNTFVEILTYGFVGLLGAFGLGCVVALFIVTVVIGLGPNDPGPK